MSRRRPWRGQLGTEQDGENPSKRSTGQRVGGVGVWEGWESCHSIARAEFKAPAERFKAALCVESPPIVDLRFLYTSIRVFRVTQHSFQFASCSFRA